MLDRVHQHLEDVFAAGRRLPDDTPPSIDFATARTEFYESPTALPIVERSSIKLDLHRRDFTINTLALRLDGRHYGELHDYWGGLDDLQRGVIRVLHSLSFVDDPTRMLRAVRFEQRFGFQIEPRTLQLLHDARDLLAKVSGDRIRHELDLMLAEPRATAMLARLHRLGLLTAIHPALDWDAAAERRLTAWKRTPCPPPPPWEEATAYLRAAYALWLLENPAREAIAARLGFSRARRAVLAGAAALYARRHTLAAARPSELTFALEPHPLEAVFALHLAVEDDALRQRLARYAAEWRRLRPHTTGHDLRARGLPPGPRYKAILRRLRAAWLDGEVHSTEEERQLLESLLAQQ